MTNAHTYLPRILIIDDYFGRSHSDRCNKERADLCARYQLKDITGDEEGKPITQTVKEPVAEAVFYRGQRPICATIGDTVENDLEGCMRIIEEGWSSKHNEPIWSLVLLDLSFYTGKVTNNSDQRSTGMPEGRPGDSDKNKYFGLNILREIQTQFPDLPVIMLSTKPRTSVSRQFSYWGALGFLDRSSQESADKLKEYLWRYGLIPDITGQIVGNSKTLLFALRTARMMANNRQSVLIRGQRGCGKELISSFINQNNKKNITTPYVIVDSGVLNPNLYASELFGHKKGSFTGADRDKEGLIIQANGGDLFLDEIGNMPLEVQLGLLRVLEYNEVTPVGSKESISVNVRFISATNIDIEEHSVSGKGFRLDLLDRLRAAGTLFLPPLCERKEDIPLLVEKFVREAENQIEHSFHRDIDQSVLDKLMAYDWPGNIRELRQCIFKSVYKHPDIEHLVPAHIIFSPTIKKDRSQIESAIVTQVQPGVSIQLPKSLEEILNDMTGFDFENLKRDELVGKLETLQQYCNTFIAHYVKSTLHATTKPVDGKVQIHPAIKMALGDQTIKASKAADIIKKILTPVSKSEPILQQALEKACQLRPKRSQQQRS